MASLSTCHLGLWLGWQILLNLVKSLSQSDNSFLQLILTRVMRMLLDDLVGEGTLQVHAGKHQLGQLQACLHRYTGVSVHL